MQGIVKRAAFVAVLAVSGLMVNAQTFLYNNVVYKASGSKLTAQKPTVAPANGEAPGDYTGDIVIPAKIEYEGKTYTVTSVGSAFKATSITSIDIADGVATISRGGFQDCVQLKSAKLPSDLVTFNGDVFSGCVLLEEIVIPGTVKEMASNQFKGCTSLRKITFEDGPTAIELSSGAFTDNGASGLQEVVINRAIGEKYTAMDSKPFRGSASIVKVSIGGSCTSLPASYFESASALKTVEFNSAFASMGTNMFAGSGIESITLPETITTIPASCFQNCKSLNSVVVGEAVTSIQDMAFYNSTLSSFEFPASLASIGQMAFSGTKLAGGITIPSQVKTIGLQAFANNTGVTSVVVPASVTEIGNGTFMGCAGISSYTVDAANENYASDAANKYIATKDGKTLLAYAPAAEGTSFSGDFESIAPYAIYKASKLESVSFPNCTSWGDYCLAETGLKSLSIGGLVGRYVASGCTALTDLTINNAEVPFGIAANDQALTNVIFTKNLTTIKQDAFLNCAAVKNLEFGSILAIIEANAFKGCGVETMTVGATTPASMAEGVFTQENAGITVKVPVNLVDAYKAAAGWKYLNIVGDANVVAGGEDMGMPSGLYYAGTDGMLHCAYSDGQFDTYDVGGVPHTFQLTQFKNRIYGASAGVKFVYSATGSVDGDGKLFYISKVGGETFQAVVLDNTGNNAYKDPFGLYIYGDTLYVNDRNVCIRKIAADAIALPQDYVSWVENNWLGYYGSPWSYGCIKSGFSITQSENSKGEAEPLYWVGMKYNGNGIFRFKEGDIGTASVPGPKSYPAIMNTISPIFTTFFIDEAHNQMYIYIEKAGSGSDSDLSKYVKGGIYRIDLDKIESNPDPAVFSDLDPILIDGSPVKYEGSATNEHVGISQFAIDENGEYLYWCYRAPSAEEAAANEAQDYTTQNGGKYWWAEAYNAENPLHQSGIKRIKLGEAQPEVEMVVAGVEGYGVVPVNYAGSTKPAGVQSVILPAAASHVTVAGHEVTVEEAAVVTVYNMAGTIVAYASLGAGETMSIADLTNGAYIVSADFENGANEVVKIVK